MIVGVKVIVVVGDNVGVREALGVIANVIVGLWFIVGIGVIVGNLVGVGETNTNVIALVATIPVNPP